MEDGLINEKLNKFAAMASNYDNVVNSVTQIEEEVDLVRAKLEAVSDSFNSSEFVMLTGTCPRKDRHII